MNMARTVRVTKADIIEGSPCNPKDCAVSRAISRALGVDRNPVSVATDGFYLSKRGRVYSLPEIARKFVEAFDKRQPVKPIEFQVEV